MIRALYECIVGAMWWHCSCQLQGRGWLEPVGTGRSWRFITLGVPACKLKQQWYNMWSSELLWYLVLTNGWLLCW